MSANDRDAADAGAAANKAPATASDESENAPSVAPMKSRHVVELAVVAAIALVALLVVGIRPRLAMQRTLAGDVDSAKSALVLVAASTATRPNKPNTLLLPGTLEALHDVAVYSRVGGYVQRWHADLGTVVGSGQLLAEIVAPELNQNVLQARAQVAQMQAALVLARANLQRYRFLAADSAVTVQELQQMEEADRAAAASVRAAEANLSSLMVMQGYLQIRAPFDGVVTARNVDNGSLISAAGASATPLTAGGTELAPATIVSAASLFRIAQTDVVRVYIDVPEPYVGSIHSGMSAELVIEDLGNKTFSGKVVRTAHAVDPQTRTLLVEVDVPNPTRVLRPGMYVQVRVTLPRTGAPIMIPSTALTARAGGPQVLELTPSDSTHATAHIRSVQVARDFGSTVEITSGLTEGAIVATIGTQILAEGQTVRFTLSATQSPGAQGVPTAAAQPRAKSSR
jgi:multidrug efflux pump subunit AcrA (membrane-fusion protein)